MSRIHDDLTTAVEQWAEWMAEHEWWMESCSVCGDNDAPGKVTHLVPVSIISTGRTEMRCSGECLEGGPL